MLLRVQILLMIIATVMCSSNAMPLKNIGLAYGLGQSFEVGYEDHTYSGFSHSVSLSIELFDSKNLSVKSFIGYDQKGSNGLNYDLARFDGNGMPMVIDSLVEVKRRSGYLHFHVTGKYRFPHFKNAEPYLFTGPRIDYLLKRTVEETWLGMDAYEITDNTTKYLFGISSGLGAAFEVSSFQVSPFIQCNVDLNKTTAEYKNDFRNIQWLAALEIAFVLQD